MFYSNDSSTPRYKLVKSIPEKLRRKGIRIHQFQLRIRNSVCSSDSAHGCLRVSHYQVPKGNRFEFEPLDRRRTFRLGTDQKSRSGRVEQRHEEYRVGKTTHSRGTVWK